MKIDLDFVLEELMSIIKKICVLQNKSPLGMFKSNFKGYKDFKYIDICMFGLSVRLLKCLKEANIRNLYDMERFTIFELMAYKNFGKKCCLELANLYKVLNIPAQHSVGGLNKFIKEIKLKDKKQTEHKPIENNNKKIKLKKIKNDPWGWKKQEIYCKKVRDQLPTEVQKMYDK